MTPRPIADQISFEEVLREHQGANAALCSSAFCALGHWSTDDRGRPSLSGGSMGSYALTLNASRFAALPLPVSAARQVAEQYGIEPPRRVYGVEEMGNGNCISAMAESEVHLCLYHEMDLDRVRLTERVNFTEGGDPGNAYSTLKPFLGAYSTILLKYGRIEGRVRWDEDQERLLLTGEDRYDPACAMIQQELILKESDPPDGGEAWRGDTMPDVRSSFQIYRRSRLKGYVERIGDWVIFD